MGNQSSLMVTLILLPFLTELASEKTGIVTVSVQDSEWECRGFFSGFNPFYDPEAATTYVTFRYENCVGSNPESKTESAPQYSAVITLDEKKPTKEIRYDAQENQIIFQHENQKNNLKITGIF